MSDLQLRAAGREVGRRVGACWPDLAREVEGIAAGAGVSAETLFAINARTELLGGVAGAECSVVAWMDEGRCVVAQNWDWHPDLAASLVLWTVRQPGGRWFATLTEAGILAKIGLSSAGLCCALNLLRCSLDGGVAGVPVHVLLRVLLDREDTLSGALRLLQGSRVTASSCVTVGSSECGAHAVIAVELSPGGCGLVRRDGDRLTHTNHFLAGPPQGDDLERLEAPSTLARRRVLLGARSPEPALRSHVGAPESVCRHEQPADPWPDRRATLACVVMEPGTPRLRLAEGRPCKQPLIEVPLP